MNNGKPTKLSKRVLQVISEAKAPIRPIDIQNILGSELNIRSIRYAINVLEEKNLVERRPDLSDLRSFYILIKNTRYQQKSIKNIL